MKSRHRYQHVAKKGGRKSNGAKRRGKIFFLLFLATCLFCALIIRLYKLQILDSNDIAKKALTQMSRNEVLQPDRGYILDRNGKKLAVNVSASTVTLNKNAFMKNGSLDQEALDQVLNKLANLLYLPKEEVYEKYKEGKKAEVVLAKDIDRATSLTIQNADLRGVYIQDQQKRFYPANNLASHLIGFMDQDGYGIYGVEKYYNDQLAGMLGKRVGLRDAKNQALTMEEDQSNLPTQGLNVRLTLDESIQGIVENIAKKAKEEVQAKAVNVIVQEVDTGAIVAMTNQDDYNLNFPKKPQNNKQQKDWEDLTGEEKAKVWFDNWRNFCINDMYEPGSTFKTITAAAALEEHTTTKDKHYYCSGYVRDVPGGPIRCASLPNPHGDLTMEEGYAKSCNVTFVRIGRELGLDRMNRYIHAFGFGQKTGIDLPGEVEGLVPDDLHNVSKLQQDTVSFGHGIATTPIQLINAVSAVVNGGNLMVPHVLKDIETIDNKPVQTYKPRVKRQVISKQTSKTMVELMEKVVSQGGGSRAAVPGYRIGGKTGTANKVSKDGGYEENKYISSCVGVAPIEKPKYTLLLIVQEPKNGYYGGAVAAPYAGQMLGEILSYEGYEKSDRVNDSQKKIDVEVPDVRNMLIEDAGRILSEKGLKFNTEYTGMNDFTMVTDQSPAPGTTVNTGTIVDLYLNPNNSNALTMPILMGKSLEEVKEILEPLEVEYTVHGSGQLVKQVPQPGAVISWKKPMELYFEPALNKDQTKEENENRSKSEEKKKSKTKKGQKKAKENNRNEEGQ